VPSIKLSPDCLDSGAGII